MTTIETSQTSEFPRFGDGDVSIVVSPTRVYQLHSSILCRNSSFFAQQLNSAPGAKLNKKAREDGLAAYCFELVKTDPTDIGHFERKEVSDSGRVISLTFNWPDLDNGRNSRSYQWDWLLGCFYDKQPDFDDSNFATLLSDCIGLVEVAERVNAVDQVCEIVDLALLRQDNVLWVSIAQNPIAWSEVGRRVQSPSIFKESVCHLVGKWHLLEAEVKDTMNESIRYVCEKKFMDLEIAKAAIEMRILGHYPPSLCRSAADRPGRTSYAADIYMWQAFCFFRQWFTQAISEDRTRRAPDGGFAFYMSLAKGGQEYLHHEDFKTFHKYFPMSSKACNVLEANMGVLKEEVKQFVGDLTKSHVHIRKEDPKTPITWLTCVVLEMEDLPWYLQEEGRIPIEKDTFEIEFENQFDTELPPRFGQGCGMDMEMNEEDDGGGVFVRQGGEE